MIDKKNAASLEGSISIFINSIIFIIKLIVGIYTHSIAVISDSIHTLSDNISSIFLIIGIKFSQKEPDKEHPFGHQRMEIITSFVIAMFLLFTGFELAKDGVISLLKPKHLVLKNIYLYLIILTILFKQFLALFAYYLAKKSESDAIKTDGYHHQSDVFSSLPVIAVLIWGNKIKWLDGALTIIISIFIMILSMKIIKENMDKLLGNAPSNEEIQNIKNDVKNVPDIYGVHDITIHSYGKMRILTLHAEMDKSFAFVRAHTKSEQLERFLENKYGFADVVIHIDPVDYNNPKILEIKEYLEGLFKNIRDFKEVHDIRIIGEDKWQNLIFDVIQKSNLSREKLNNILEKIKNEIKEKYPNFKDIVINVDPFFNY